MSALSFFSVCLLVLSPFSTDYLDVIDMYRRGEVDAALEHLHEIAPGSINNLLAQWEERAFRPGDDVVQAAAVMHTDFAMRAVDELKFTLAGYHVGVAKRLVERIQNRQKHERFHRDWLLAVGYFFQSSIFVHGASDSFHVARTVSTKA